MADKILKSFEVWVAAQGVKSRTRLRSVDNISLEGIERLRALILDLAIRGKLVPQDSKEESASIFIKKISAKETMKKILLEPIDEGEKFIKLPFGWVWVKLGSVGDTNIGLTYSPNDVSDSGTPVLRSSNIQNGKIDYDDLVRVSGNIPEKNFVKQGDLLICARNGSKSLVGKCAIIPRLNEQMSFGAFMAIFRSDVNDYVKIFLESPHYRSRLEGVSTTTINQITQDNLKNTVVPLPPLAEQHRIVAKVEELMALCDELEKQETHHLKSHALLVETLLGTLTQAKDAREFHQAWSLLAQHFDDLFTTEDSIDQLKQTILQLAVMGKLVPQDPKDEPAIELLNRIKGKVHDKSEIQIEATRKIHFEIPSSWICCTLGDVVITTQGVQISKNDQIKTQEEGYNRYLYISDFESDDDIKYVKDVYPSKLVTVDDLIVVNTGATSGKVLRGIPGILSNNLFKVSFDKKSIATDYLYYFINSSLFKEVQKKLIKGGANPHMGHKNFNSTLFPLPPINEQQRIVSKVNELFALCDGLKARLAAAQRLANQMAEGVVA